MGYMRIKKTNTIVGLLSIVVFAVILLTVSVVYFTTNNDAGKKPAELSTENMPNYDKPTGSQKSAGYDAKENFLNNQQSQGGSLDATTSSDLLTITSASQNGTQYQLRVTIDAIDANGTCILTLSRAGQDDSMREVGTQVQGSYSICKGFDISTSGLNKGEWQATIVYKGAGGSSSVKGRVNVE